MGALRGYKHGADSEDSRGASHAAAQPSGDAEGSLQVPLQAFPLQERAGFVCAMALGIQSHLRCRCEQFHSDWQEQ